MVAFVYNSRAIPRPRWTMTTKAELNLLASWKIKLAVLAAIITPSVTVTGAYYKVQSQVIEAKTQLDQRVNAVELSTQKSFAEKTDLKEMQRKLDDLHDDVTEIKTILKRR